jgi:hypothetical protein
MPAECSALPSSSRCCACHCHLHTPTASAAHSVRVCARSLPRAAAALLSTSVRLFHMSLHKRPMRFVVRSCMRPCAVVLVRLSDKDPEEALAALKKDPAFSRGEAKGFKGAGAAAAAESGGAGGTGAPAPERKWIVPVRSAPAVREPDARATLTIRHSCCAAAWLPRCGVARLLCIPSVAQSAHSAWVVQALSLEACMWQLTWQLLQVENEPEWNAWLKATRAERNLGEKDLYVQARHAQLALSMQHSSYQQHDANSCPCMMPAAVHERC